MILFCSEHKIYYYPGEYKHMSDRIYIKLPVPLSVLFISIILFALRNAALCEFLLDEVAPAKEAREEKAPGEPVKRSDFPPHVVTRIKAQPIPDIRGAVRITWETDPSAMDDFIVGRSRVAPNTREKALAAISIKVIPAGSPGRPSIPICRRANTIMLFSPRKRWRRRRWMSIPT